MLDPEYYLQINNIFIKSDSLYQQGNPQPSAASPLLHPELE